MRYLGLNEFEFTNGIKINFDDLKDILIEIFVSKNYEVQQDILNVITNFENIYTEDDVEKRVDDIIINHEDRINKEIKDSYLQGYKDGVLELKQKYPYINNIIEFYDGSE